MLRTAATRLELTDTTFDGEVVVEGRMRDRGLRLEARHDGACRLTLRARQPLRAIISSADAHRSTFDLVQSGDMAFDEAVHVRCEDNLRVGWVTALQSRELREGLRAFLALGPSTTIDAEGAHVVFTGGEERLGELVTLISRGEALLRQLEALSIKPDERHRSPLEAVVERLGLTWLNGEPLAEQLSGQRDGSTVTLTLHEGQLELRVAPPWPITGRFQAHDHAQTAALRFFDDDAFEQAVDVLVEPSQQRSMHELLVRPTRAQLRNLFHRLPTAIIDGGGLRLRGSVDDATHLARIKLALVEGPALVNALARLGVTDEIVQVPFEQLTVTGDAARFSSQVAWLLVVLFGVPFLVALIINLIR